MQDLSLLAETHMLVLGLEPRPAAKEVIAALWLGSVRSGSCSAVESSSRRLESDQMWISESSEPVMM